MAYDLVVTSPQLGSNTRGTELRSYIDKVQLMLARKGYGVALDKVWGPESGGQAREWKWDIGFAKKHINTRLTQFEADFLFGKRKPAPIMAWRAGWRKRNKPNFDPAIGNVKSYNAMQQMLKWAESGVKEYPAGDNKVPWLAGFAKAHGLSDWYQKMGWPWCAFSAFLASLAQGSPAAKAGFAGKFNVLYVPDILRNAQNAENNLRVVSFQEARPGDLVIFNFDGGVVDHIGRLVNKLSNQTIRTVEGNTSYDDAGSQANGGAVAERIRPITMVQAFVREI